MAVKGLACYFPTPRRRGITIAFGGSLSCDEAPRGLHSRGVMASGSSPGPRNVVVAGGGFAALEIVLGLRALAGRVTEISLVAPDSVLAYRPAATLEAFEDTAPRAFNLGEITADLGVRYHRTRIESVGPARRRVRLGACLSNRNRSEIRRFRGYKNVSEGPGRAGEGLTERHVSPSTITDPRS
jgi:hypothetical protein